MSLANRFLTRGRCFASALALPCALLALTACEDPALRQQLDQQRAQIEELQREEVLLQGKIQPTSLQDPTRDLESLGEELENLKKEVTQLEETQQQLESELLEKQTEFDAYRERYPVR